MAAASVDQSLTRLITCPVCSEDFNDKTPRELSCRHVLCDDCIQNMIEETKLRSPDDLNKIFCPICNIPTVIHGGQAAILPLCFLATEISDVREQLRDRHAICQICETDTHRAEISSYCCTCNSGFCQGCRLDHDSVSPDHKLIQISSSVIEYIICREHDSLLDHFCLTCSRAICFKCYLKEHIKHKVHSMTYDRKEAGEDIKDILTTELETVKKAKNKLDSLQADVETNMITLYKNLLEHRDKMIEIINHQYSSLYDEVKVRHDDIQQEIVKTKKYIDDVRKTLEKLINETTSWRQPIKEVPEATVTNLMADVRKQIPATDVNIDIAPKLHFIPGTDDICLGEIVEGTGEICLGEIEEGTDDSCLGEIVEGTDDSCLGEIVEGTGEICLGEIEEGTDDSCLGESVEGTDDSCLGENVEGTDDSCLGEIEEDVTSSSFRRKPTLLWQTEIQTWPLKNQVVRGIEFLENNHIIVVNQRQVLVYNEKGTEIPHYFSRVSRDMSGESELWGVSVNRDKSQVVFVEYKDWDVQGYLHVYIKQHVDWSHKKYVVCKRPGYVSFTNTDDYLVSSWIDKKIYKYNQQGIQVMCLQMSCRPQGLCVDSKNRIIVCLNKEVCVYDENGTKILTSQTKGTDLVLHEVCVSRDDNILVCDFPSQFVLLFDKNGVFIKILLTLNISPWKMSLYKSKYLAVYDLDKNLSVYKL